MTRLALGAAFTLFVASTSAARADIEIPLDVQTAADEAGVPAIDLLGAVVTTNLPPRAYLCQADGVLCPKPQPVISAAVSSRVACLELAESGGANVANRQGSGAVGVLQYQPSTFAAHAAEIGHPEYSPWNPAQARAVAAHDLAMGRRSQWTVRGC